MDIKNYIESGILEEYILGSLSPSQAVEVEKNITSYPEIKTYFEKLEETLLIIARNQAMDTPADLRTQIVDRFKNINGRGGGSGGSGGGIFTWAAMALAVAAGFLGWLYYDANTSLITTGEEVTALRTEMDAYIVECDSIREENIKLKEFADWFFSENLSKVPMGGTEKYPNHVANLYVNIESGDAYLDIHALPQLDVDKSYQLWAIVDGKPKDMGIYALTTTSYVPVLVPYEPEAQAFAITIEPAGGSESPTLEEMVVVGTYKG